MTDSAELLAWDGKGGWEGRENLAEVMGSATLGFNVLTGRRCLPAMALRTTARAQLFAVCTAKIPHRRCYARTHSRLHSRLN